MSDKQEVRYIRTLKALRDEFGPKLNITPKDKWYWKPFKGDYGITLGYTIGLPDSWPTMTYPAKIAMLMHEAQHIRQQLKFGRGNIYLGFLLQMLVYLLFPFPVVFAWGRAKLEMEGYKETLRGYYLTYDKNPLVLEELRDFIIEQFTGRRYGWMWPFKSYMNKWFDNAVKEVILEEG